MPRNRSESYRAIVAPATLITCAEATPSENGDLILVVSWNQTFANQLQDYWRTADKIRREFPSFSQIEFRCDVDVYHRSGSASDWLDIDHQEWDASDGFIICDTPPAGMHEWNSAVVYNSRINIYQRWAGFEFYTCRGDEFFETGGQIVLDDDRLFRDAK